MTSSTKRVNLQKQIVHNVMVVCFGLLWQMAGCKHYDSIQAFSVVTCKHWEIMQINACIKERRDKQTLKMSQRTKEAGNTPEQHINTINSRSTWVMHIHRVEKSASFLIARSKSSFRNWTCMRVTCHHIAECRNQKHREINNVSCFKFIANQDGTTATNI